jgi:hypothetical protein
MRSMVSLHGSNSGTGMSVEGQLHALPRRSIAVRFTSTSRPRQDGFDATLSAISRLMQCSKSPSFNHLVGEQLHRVGHLDAERPGRLQIDDEFEFR